MPPDDPDREPSLEDRDDADLEASALRTAASFNSLTSTLMCVFELVRKLIAFMIAARVSSAFHTGTIVRQAKNGDGATEDYCFVFFSRGTREEIEALVKHFQEELGEGGPEETHAHV